MGDLGQTDEGHGAPLFQTTPPESGVEIRPVSGGSALEQLGGGSVAEPGSPWPSEMPWIPEDGDLPGTLPPDLPPRTGSRGDLYGLVFHVEHMPAEPPDFNGWIWLSRFFLLCLIPGTFFLMIAHAHRTYGPLAIFALVAVFWVLARMPFAGILGFFALLGLSRLFRPFASQGQRQVPVRVCRILDHEQQEHIVRIKGNIVRGALAEHDLVEIWGRRRRGTWLFRRGYNVRAQAPILLEGRYSWLPALILGALTGWMLWDFHRLYPRLLW